MAVKKVTNIFVVVGVTRRPRGREYEGITWTGTLWGRIKHMLASSRKMLAFKNLPTSWWVWNPQTPCRAPQSDYRVSREIKFKFLETVGFKSRSSRLGDTLRSGVLHPHRDRHSARQLWRAGWQTSDGPHAMASKSERRWSAQISARRLREATKLW